MREDRLTTLLMELKHTHPDCQDVWNVLGVLHLSRKEHTEALQAFRSGLALNPADVNLTTNCIQTLMQMGRLSDAQAVGKKYLEAGGPLADVETLLSMSNAQQYTTGRQLVEEIHVDSLHLSIGCQKPIVYPREFLTTPLDRWKMEINDSPIFRYLYRQFQPRRHLEFGTWQGAGVVYCLEESNATVWTINLPFGEEKPEGGDQYSGNGDSFGLGTAMAEDWASRIGLPFQASYRTDCFGFIGRYYLEKSLGNRVCQIYCDSRQWDDSAYPDGFFDTILIDGGHTADIVTSDTQKAMRLLRPGGLLLWHDFCPPVADKFPVTRGVMDGLAPLLPKLQKQFDILGWINPSWILIGKKK